MTGHPAFGRRSLGTLPAAIAPATSRADAGPELDDLCHEILNLSALVNNPGMRRDILPEPLSDMAHSFSSLTINSVSAA